MNGEKQLLTNSRMACAKACLKRHYFSYELGIRPARESESLSIGRAVHEGIEAYGKATGTFEDRKAAALAHVAVLYETPPENMLDLNAWAIQRVKVERLVHAYLCRYQGEEMETVAVEQVFNLPLINPETGAPSRIFALAGKLDRIVKLPDGRLAVLETKTTSDSLDDGSDYWNRLRLDSQISLYYYAARQLNFAVECVIYDVLKKPDLRQSMATPPDKRKYTKQGALYAGQREVDETPDEFADRFSADMAARPEHYFARREIPRLQADIDEAQSEWWMQAQLLHDCARTGRWFRNTASCLMPYRCAYCELCFNNVNVQESLPSNFIRVENVNPELMEG